MRGDELSLRQLVLKAKLAAGLLTDEERDFERDRDLHTKIRIGSRLGRCG